MCGATATYIFDPPYKHNKEANATGAYGLGVASSVDFGRIADIAKNLSGQVIVHEQEGATWLPFVTLTEKAITGHRKDGKAKMRHEVVWISDSTQRQGRLFC